MHDRHADVAEDVGCVSAVDDGGERFPAVGEGVRFEEVVFAGVACDLEFRAESVAGTERFCGLYGVEDPLCVTAEVQTPLIQITSSNYHTFNFPCGLFNLPCGSVRRVVEVPRLDVYPSQTLFAITDSVFFFYFSRGVDRHVAPSVLRFWANRVAINMSSFWDFQRVLLLRTGLLVRYKNCSKPQKPLPSVFSVFSAKSAILTRKERSPRCCDRWTRRTRNKLRTYEPDLFIRRAFL